MGADEAQLEDVTQSGDSPGGAGSESQRPGRAIRYKTEPMTLEIQTQAGQEDKRREGL